MQGVAPRRCLLVLVLAVAAHFAGRACAQQAVEDRLAAMEMRIPRAFKGIAIGDVKQDDRSVATWKIEFAVGPAWCDAAQLFKEGDFGWVPRTYARITADGAQYYDFSSKRCVLGRGFDRVAMGAAEPWISVRGWLRSVRFAQRQGQSIDVLPDRIVIMDPRQRVEIEHDALMQVAAATVIGADGARLARQEYSEWQPLGAGTAHPRRVVDLRYREGGRADEIHITLSEMVVVDDGAPPEPRALPADAIYLDELRGEMRQAGKVIGPWPPPGAGGAGSTLGSWISSRTVTIAAGVGLLLLAGVIYQFKRRAA